MSVFLHKLNCRILGKMRSILIDVFCYVLPQNVLTRVRLTDGPSGYFWGESDRYGHHPLYESIVLKAREQGLAGATVLRGLMGFGKHMADHLSSDQ